MGTESLAMMGCIFAENGPIEGGIEASLNGTGWGAKGDFRWILGLYPCIFEALLLKIIKIAPILHQIWKDRYKDANNHSIDAVKAYRQQYIYGQIPEFP